MLRTTKLWHARNERCPAARCSVLTSEKNFRFLLAIIKLCPMLRCQHHLTLSKTTNRRQIRKLPSASSRQLASIPQRSLLAMRLCVTAARSISSISEQRHGKANAPHEQYWLRIPCYPSTNPARGGRQVTFAGGLITSSCGRVRSESCRRHQQWRLSGAWHWQSVPSPCQQCARNP